MRPTFPLKSFELAIFILSALALTACGSNKGTAGDVAATSKSYSSIDGRGSTTGGSGSTSNPVTQVGSPLEFGIDGTGNHARHICVPATKKLVLRIRPIATFDPLFPYNPLLINAKNGLPLYDGSPAIYSKLRVRMSIPGSAAAWDFVANTDAYSVAGDYSSYLRAVPATTISQTAQLPIPEYTADRTVYGSNPQDGTCTYWEAQVGRCSQLSSVLRASEAVACPAGQQKILITMIATDYPCQNDPVGWCQGGAMQIVPDYQHWMMTVQAVTENTRGF